MPHRFVDYKVSLLWDDETALVVADVPALGIADDGTDAPTALDSVREMAAFHIEGLIEKGQHIPEEPDQGEGVFIRVRVPVRAATTTAP